jgi:hypothetical protein
VEDIGYHARKAALSRAQGRAITVGRRTRPPPIPSGVAEPPVSAVVIGRRPHVAGSTLPSAALPGGVYGRHRMPALTGIPPCSAPDVLLSGNGFKVMGVTASAVPAQVVNLHPRRNRPECLLVYPAVRHHPLAVDPLRAIAIPVTAPLPQDALARVNRADHGSLTNRNSRLLPQCERSLGVDLWRHGFKVTGVHTGLHVTEMVDLQSLGNWSVGALIVPAMCHCQAARASVPFQSVAAVVAAHLPDPTAVLVDEIFGSHGLIMRRWSDSPELGSTALSVRRRGSWR